MRKQYMEWIRSIKLYTDAQGPLNNPLSMEIEPEEEQSIRNAALRFNRTYGYRRGIIVSVHYDWASKTITIVGRERTAEDNAPMYKLKNQRI